MFDMIMEFLTLFLDETFNLSKTVKANKKLSFMGMIIRTFVSLALIIAMALIFALFLPYLNLGDNTIYGYMVLALLILYILVWLTYKWYRFIFKQNN